MAFESIVNDRGIYGFFGEYRYLSNFHLCRVIVDGKEFPSTEHAYMYAKLADKERDCSFFKDEGIDNKIGPFKLTNWYNEVISMSCREVKTWGQMVDLRSDWEDIKLRVMENALYSKFTLNEDLKQKLKETGDLYLEESNWWRDRFWGVCEGKGENHLGKLLMKIRNDLKWMD